MSDLRPQVRTAIENFVTHHQHHQTASDILRVIQEEAILMKETEDVRNALISDPYDHLENISSKAMERFQQWLRVTQCDRVRVGDSVARIHAVVAWPAKLNQMELTFLYERRPRKGIPPDENGNCSCQVSYTIELAYDHGQRQRLLEVVVWAASNVPSHEPAVCIHNEIDSDDEGGWEDIDDDGDDGEGAGEVDTETPSLDVKPSAGDVSTTDGADTTPSSAEDVPAPKKQKVDDDQEHNIRQSGHSDLDSKDQYVAFLDPDLLQSFLESAGILPMDDAAAFFLLMTFPFFEHEWDLVSFVLDQFFGSGSDDEEE